MQYPKELTYFVSVCCQIQEDASTCKPCCDGYYCTCFFISSQLPWFCGVCIKCYVALNTIIQKLADIGSNVLLQRGVFQKKYQPLSLLGALVSCFTFLPAGECRVSIVGYCQGSFSSFQKRYLQQFVLVITSTGLKIARAG